MKSIQQSFNWFFPLSRNRVFCSVSHAKCHLHDQNSVLYKIEKNVLIQDGSQLRMIFQEISMWHVVRISMIIWIIRLCMGWDMLVIGLFHDGNGNNKNQTKLPHFILKKSVFLLDHFLRPCSSWWSSSVCILYQAFGWNGPPHRS